ncbi:MAG: thiamine diphosphokinase [Treponema sp.]|nr:thiamine diphosphokinase [Treponema sp.]
MNQILIFTGGKYTEPQNSIPYFNNLPQIDCVIAADSGLDTLEKYQEFYGGKLNLIPDFILGDMDSILNTKLLEKYSDKLQIFPKDKDFTDTELALNKAHEYMNEKASDDIITIIGGSGGFADHFLGILDTFSTELHADFWLCEDQLICYLKKNDILKISKLKINDRISIARTTDSYESGSIKTEGLEWESPLFRRRGMPSISNRISNEYEKKGKPVRITVMDGKFLVIMPVNASLKKESLHS